MPTYEYECKKCGLVFEQFQSMTAEPLSACRNTECGGKVHRLLSGGAGFLFKGSGFYSTDYRSESYKKAAKADTGGDTPSASSSKGTSSSSGSGTSSSKTTDKPSSGSSSKAGSSSS